MKWSNGVRWVCRVMLCLMAVVTLTGFVAATTAQAEGVTVTIQSFMRAVSADKSIRNSELMEAVLTGYDGNPYELIYEWENENCSADLYMFNSYNMSNIDDTDGEIAGISSGRSASGKGFAWAAMRSRSARNYNGTVTVTVRDASGNVLATDSYTDFLAPNLGSDMDGIAVGMFIGEKVNVKDLLGRSAILHITCSGASVSQGSIKDSSIAKLTKEGDYFVEGVQKGYTEATITVSKSMCSFHNGGRATVTTPVYVFRQPTTSTTTTTLTLNNLDEDCEYFIGSMEGQPVGNTIVFSGLSPNTTYQVTARGRYQDGDTVKYAYAYVTDTTKPVYTAQVNTYLDGVLQNIEDIHEGATALYLKDMDDPSADYIPMTNSATGVYSVGVENGRYQVYQYENGSHVMENAAFLQINSQNVQISLHHYSVAYNTDGGSFAQGEAPGTVIYPAGDEVRVTTAVPSREGHSFTGWAYGGKTYQPGDVLTRSISSAMELTAQWEKAVNITVHVTINHQGGDGYDQTAEKADLDVYLLEKRPGSAFLETGDELHFTPANVTDEDGGAMPYDYDAAYLNGEAQLPENVSITTYTASEATYIDRSDTSEFDVKVQKSSYDVQRVECAKDDQGNWIINVSLVFNPSNFDLAFSVHMAQDVPKELYPDAVIYKVAFWSTDRSAWEIITQMEGNKGGARVDIDPESGIGSGSYPVWTYEDSEPYGYRVVLTGFVYDDQTIIVPDEAPNTVVSYTDGKYTAVMSDVTDGKRYGSDLYGAYYDGTEKKQKGTLDAEVSVATYDVTFNAMGGKVNGQDAQTVTKQHYIPDFSDHQPVYSGHTFLGWYEDEAYTIPADENELLTADVVLYARWDRVLTGTVTVEGTYLQDGQTVTVWERDRAESVNVILQEITGASTLNIDSKELAVTWNGTAGTTAGYEFSALSPDKTYRVVFDVMNYTATYRNAASAPGYNETAFTAVYGDGSVETFVDGNLKFTPVSYDQPVTVDASRIGEGFRPDSVLAQIFYRALDYESDWQIISQHTVDPEGIVMSMDGDGYPTHTYTESVWVSEWDGTLYEYQVVVNKLEGDASADWPVDINYSAASRWSHANNAPTATLKAALVPNIYNVVYHLNDGTDAVENGSHTWSFDTPVSYEPQREGYTFEGWYDNAACEGGEVTSISAAVREDVELYAKWEPRSDLQLKVNHVDAETDEVLLTETLSVTFGETCAGEPLKKTTITGYTYDSCEPESVTITTGENEITLYYTRDTYSYTVYYLNQDGFAMCSAKFGSGKYGAEITENALIFEGYTVDAESRTVTLDADNKEIVFRYTPRNDLTYQVNYLDEETLAPVAAAKVAAGMTYRDTVTGASEVIAIDGYTFVSADKAELTIGVDDAANVINLYYAEDKLLDSAQTDAPDDRDSLTGGDSVPDKYQKKITFKVVKGTWADGTADDIAEILTLMLDGKWDVNGTAALTAPEGMIADEGFLQDAGAWDAEVPETVSGTNDETYTYTFPRGLEIVVPGNAVSYIVEHYKADADDVYPAEPTDTEILAGAIGATVTAVPKTYEGYCLNAQESTQSGTLVKIEADSDIVVLQLFYNKDAEHPDNIPDMYQKQVTFKVVNGTWANGTAQDIVVCVTLMKDDRNDPEGTASLTVPVGMKAFADYTDGQWDITPPGVVSGTDDEVYTYFYVPMTVPPQTGDAMNPVLCMALMSVSGLLFALCVSKRKARI